MSEIKNRLKKTFLEMINISEVYPEENKIVSYLMNRLKENDIEIQKDSFGNLIAKVSGKEKGTPLLLNTHMDIPEPNPNVKYSQRKDVIKSSGENILGADPKSGLAIIVEFLVDYASDKSNNKRAIEAVFTRGEEAGLRGAINLDYSLLDSIEGVVLDEDGPVTQVVSQAPCFVKFDAQFTGKAVHPREPENGVNALQVASEAISSVNWGYSHNEVTWNIGILKSGTARNTVPGKAELEAELRSFNTRLAQKEGERIEKIFKNTAKKHGASCQVQKELFFEGYKLSQQRGIIKKMEKVYNEMDLKPNFFATFGGSDANVINSHGINVATLGSGYHNAHQHNEYVDLSEMEQIYWFLKRLAKV
ncbi:MAG: M20/M25/M40 family metallo-hydrolase [Candidatus Moranbacteria bacterium]|nr:M20/M25/M40 family metallo-hydrolase [Candidatus Moranbacteria bacterium]